MNQLLKSCRVKDCAIFVLVALAMLVSSSCQEQISYPAPVVSSLSPSSASAGNPAFTLTVTGAHLTPASTVLWNGSPRISFFQDDAHITANIFQSDIENPGNFQVTVVTPQPGGGTSNPPVDFTVNAVAVPVPAITSITPTQVYASSGAFTLRVFGTNFVANSIVTINGANHTTFEVNSTQLTSAIDASDVTNTGTLQVAVLNLPIPNPPAGEAPGGGSSNIVNLPITNPVPLISSISPTSAEQVGAAGSTSLTVTGAGIVPNSVVLVNGSPRITALSGAATLAATLTAGDLANSGMDQIQVMNPSPGGGVSNALPFAVNPSLTGGLPTLLDYAFTGAVSNNGVCGTTCASLASVPNLTTAGPAISSGGTQVVFASTSSNLIANQGTSASEIFLRTTCLGNATCVPTSTDTSIGPNGLIANGPSTEPALDSGGSHVVYTSAATNLTNYATVLPGPRQIYWQPVCLTGSGICSSAAVLVSMGADGNPANGDSYNPSVSPDGQFVAFVSLATNLVSGVTVNGSTPQVYVHTMCTGATPVAPVTGCAPTTYLVSSADGVTPGNAPSLHPSVSSGGDYVAFSSSATNLGPAAPNPGARQEVFVQQVCEISTVGCTTPFTSLASTPDGVTPADSASMEPAISQDGRFIAFATGATNLGAATGGVQQIFIRDTCATVATGTICAPSTKLVSTADGTTAANGLSEEPSLSETCTSTGTTACSTATGPLVAFATQASNLGPNVTTGVENIFVRNTCLSAVVGTACAGTTLLVSLPSGVLPEPSNGSSVMPAISTDGHTVAFLSFATNLVSANTGSLEHVYIGATGF